MKQGCCSLKWFQEQLLQCCQQIKSSNSTSQYFVCLFEVFVVPFENFSLKRRRHHYRWRAVNLALVATEQWGFFSVPYLLWHGTSVCNGNLWGPVTLTPFAKHLAVELSLPVFATWVCRSWNLKTRPSACEANGPTHCATAAVSTIFRTLHFYIKHIIIRGLFLQYLILHCIQITILLNR